ncbi:MAG TPA: DUF2071 domain-containing protein [Bryobacteraceae bacterium]|jgi:hypothetical protein|nr:DUF2071 domain-containing protein [Bryobacteraceae bacterium]
MLHLLKRHPFPVKAFFRQSLILTYAFPSHLLQPLLPPGLALDTYGEYGFLAIALVQAERLRPSFLPAALGRDFMLSGYRIFARLATRTCSLRGLWILRSNTNRQWMATAGNVFTHYKYGLCQAELKKRFSEIEWNIRTPRQEADLRVIAHTDHEPALLPAGSPFLNFKDARRFAGPLPYTFDYERETHSIIRIQGVRQEWHPKPVTVQVLQNTFLRQKPFCHATAILANAFHVHAIPYRWNRGIRTPLETT